MSSRTRPYSLLVGATASWGIGTVISKSALGDFPALGLLVVQLAASVTFLLVVNRVRKQRLLWSANLRRVAALGVLNPGVAYALGLIGLAHISAGTAVLLWAIEPALITALAIVTLGERPSRIVYVTMGTAVLGVLLVVFQPGASGSAFGVSVTVLAVSMCALYTVLARVFAVDESALTATLVQQLAALGFALVLAAVAQAVTGAGVRFDVISSSSWALAAGSGLLYYAAAFWMWLGGLQRVPATQAGVFLTLVPVFGVAAATLVGERLELQQWAGAVLVVVSVGLLMRSTAALTPDGRGAP